MLTNPLAPEPQRRFSSFTSLWRKLDSYLFQEVLLLFGGTTLFILFILLMFQCLRLAEYFIVQKASGVLLLKMTAFMLISFLPITLPLAFLLAVLMTFGRLSAESELVAMKAGGVSFLRIVYPVGLLATGVTVISLFINLSWVPWATVTAKRHEMMIRNAKVVSAVQGGTFTRGFFNLLLFADESDPAENRLRRVFIYDEREKKNPLTYLAQEADIIPVQSEEGGAAILLRLHRGSMHQNHPEEQTYERVNFKTYNLYLKVAGAGHVAFQKPQMIAFSELKRRIAAAVVGSSEHSELTAEFWKRITLALSPLLFVFVGIGFGTQRARVGRADSIMIGFLLIFCYWLVQAFAVTLAEQGKVPAFLILQLPNFVMTLLGILGIRRAIW